jgi:hypothetical protein
MLAKSGPFPPAPVLLFTPALLLAEDHSDPKASPPPLEDGFCPGLPSEAAVVDDEYEGVVALIGVEAADVDD